MSEDKSRDKANYTMGYGEEFQKLLRRRNAEDCASHLLAHLSPGMSVLDIGSGPGTISVGLAKAVEPGEFRGIDMEESQVEAARAAAQAGGHENAEFLAANAKELPFEDGSFDAVHCHAVLIHAPDTARILSEALRVLKPGGIMAAREMFTESSFFEPEIPDSWATFAKLLAANGGHPQMGRNLRRTFLDAGFSDVRTGFAFESFCEEEDTAFLHGMVVGWFFSDEVIKKATRFMLATKEQFDEMRRGLDEWKDTPGAASGFAWGWATGRK